MDEGRKRVLLCDNQFEREFARFLDGATDVKGFSKLPQPFGFSIEYTDPAMNLRSYYPDFIAMDDKGTRWILETKGAETGDVPYKDAGRYTVVRECDRVDRQEVDVLEGSAKGFRDPAAHAIRAPECSPRIRTPPDVLRMPHYLKRPDIRWQTQMSFARSLARRFRLIVACWQSR